MCKKAWCTCKDVFFRQPKPIVPLLFGVAVAKTPYKVVLIQKFCYHGNVTSHFSSLLNINLIFSWLLRRHIRTPRVIFLRSSRNKFDVRETLLVVNLQAKVAPSHIGANHLPSHERILSRGLGDSIELSEIKKNKTNKKHTSFIDTADLSITNNFHFKTKQTITEDFDFSHFHTNYCTGGKPIQKGDVGKKLRFFFFAT